jgi:hypothetical protein
MWALIASQGESCLLTPQNFNIGFVSFKTKFYFSDVSNNNVFLFILDNSGG